MSDSPSRSMSSPNCAEASQTQKEQGFAHSKSMPVSFEKETGWHRDEALRRARARSSLVPIFDPAIVTIMDVVEETDNINEVGIQRLVSKVNQRAETADEFPFWPAAAVALIMGVLSIVPYNMILQQDPGSPLFIGFATHICFVAFNASNLKGLLLSHQIPKSYHAACVILGFLFTFLKSDASARLPLSMSAVLQNLQMLIGVVVQWVVLGSKYSLSQLAACALVTFGVAAAGQAASRQSASLESSTSNFVIGNLEMVGALVSLTLLGAVVQAAFKEYGEHRDEQLVVQHLFSIPIFLLSWDKVGPRLTNWATGGDLWMLFLLFVNIALTFGNKKASLYMMGRAPNLLIVQLVETVTKFLALVLTALMNAPPFPTLGFWFGAVVLVLGTICFLIAPDAAAKVKKVE